MKLVLGVGVVGKAVIEYYKNQEVCFYDDVLKECVDKSGREVPFFSSWEEIEVVIISPGFSEDHKMIKEAKERKIKLDTDISIFLREENENGVKIGITGTNGKSTLCALLKYILEDLAEVGGNFGKSPLEFAKNNFYIMELSSYQLFWLDEESLSKLDIGIITNISNHHLKYHKSKTEYARVKKKILKAKNTISNVTLEEGEKYPKNVLFEKKNYKLAWNIIVKILDILNFSKKRAAQKLTKYIPLRYRQEVINESPLVINDSKSTNMCSMICAIENMKKAFVLIAQLIEYNNEEINIYNYYMIQKIFILSSQEVKNLKIPYLVSNDFEIVVSEAIKYAKENELDILFSPGETSFEFFKNFEHRGEVFTNLVRKIMKVKDGN